MDRRNMPYSQEAEQSVLGAAFYSKEALQKVCDELDRDDFYLEAHILIYDVIKDLNDEGVPIDITIVSDRLENNKTLTRVGNIEYLLDVINSVPNAANLDYYINIVREKSLLRKLINVSTDISTSSYTSDGPVNEILDEAERKIFDVVKKEKLVNLET